MSYDQTYASVHKIVEDFLDRNSAGTGVLHLTLDPEARDHLIRCGTSMLMSRSGLGPPGGSFVQAVLRNDLADAVTRADSTNQEALRFYVTLLHNVAIPIANEKA